MKKLRKEVDECLRGVNGDFVGMMDILHCTAFNVTIDEIEDLCRLATDEELSMITDALGKLDGTTATFTQIRSALEVRNKYVEYYQTK